MTDAAKVESPALQQAAMPVLFVLSTVHFLNDMIQSLIPAIYPIIKSAYALDFGQIGIITLTFQLTACLFQPLVGHVTDRKPRACDRWHGPRAGGTDGLSAGMSA